MFVIKIIYREGTEEEYSVDEYEVVDGFLCTYVKLGVHSGKRYIALDLIKEFITY